MEQAKAEIDRSPIEEVLRDVDMALSGLEKSIEELKGKLTSISISQTEESLQEKGKVDRARCPVESEIADYVYRINEQKIKVQKMTIEIQV